MVFGWSLRYRELWFFFESSFFFVCHTIFLPCGPPVLWLVPARPAPPPPQCPFSTGFHSDRFRFFFVNFHFFYFVSGFYEFSAFYMINHTSSFFLVTLQNVSPFLINFTYFHAFVLFHPFSLPFHGTFKYICCTCGRLCLPKPPTFFQAIHACHCSSVYIISPPTDCIVNCICCFFSSLILELFPRFCSSLPVLPSIFTTYHFSSCPLFPDLHHFYEFHHALSFLIIFSSTLIIFIIAIISQNSTHSISYAD